MISQTVTIPLTPEESVSGILSVPDRPAHDQTTGQTTGLVFAHGAANDMHHPLIAACADGLAEQGYLTLRFNFLYRERGRKSVEPEHRLVLAWQQAIRFLAEHPACGRIIAVGKSLGARIAAQAFASGDIAPDRMIFLGYPLHAPGRKDRLRDQPLYASTVPLLFFEGTRDPFCDLSLLRPVLDRLTCPVRLEIIRDGDHSFKRPKSAADHPPVHDLIIDTCREWLEQDMGT